MSMSMSMSIYNSYHHLIPSPSLTTIRYNTGTVKAYCANLGDSRCCLVALQKEYTSMRTNDHKSNKDLNAMTLDDLDASAHSSVWNMSSSSHR